MNTVFSLLIIAAYGTNVVTGEIANFSDLMTDENGHLSSHWLLFSSSCDRNIIKSTWNSHSDSSLLRRLSPMSLGFAKNFDDDFDGKHCMAVCLERGTPRNYIKVPIPEMIYHETGSVLLKEWMIGKCIEIEIGFISYYPNPLYVNWLADNGDSIKISDLKYGEQNTFWTVSRLGHKFEVVDSTNGTIVKSVVAEYNSFHPIGYPESVLQVLPNEEKLVKEMFVDEVERSQTVTRTFTQFGFAKGRLPEDVWGSIQTYHYNNRDNWTPEEYEDVSINWYEVPPLFLGMPWGLKGYWQTRLQQVVQRWIGSHIPIENTDIYGIRKYQDGARLLTHVDRTSTHAVSLIINIAQSGLRRPWMVEIYDHAYRLHEVEMNPGDIVYYESARCLHGRMTPLDGGYYVNIFTHYRPSGDPNWFTKPNPEGTPEPVYDITGLEVPTISPSKHEVKSDEDLFAYWKMASPVKSEGDDASEL